MLEDGGSTTAASKPLLLDGMRPAGMWSISTNVEPPENALSNLQGPRG